LPPRGPRFTTDLKRKEHYRESPVGSEENKRRKFPPSNMAAQVPGSRFWRSDGDDDKIDEDKGKPRKGEEWMRSELSRLQAEAENDKRNNKRNKQAMLLSLMQKQQRLDEAESNIRFWQLQVKTTKETAKEVLRKECAAHERAQTTTARNAQLVIQGLQAEIDHLQDVNATITSDLHELRVLESEAAAKRKDQHLGLPPAYGNLDDEDRFPPYSKHEDGGTIEVAHLKREARQFFEVVITGALNSEVEKRSKLELLGTLAFGLNEVCDILQKLLDIAPKVPVSLVRKPSDYGGYIDLLLRSLVDSVREEGDANRDYDTLECEHPKIINDIRRCPAYAYLPGYAIIQKDASAPYVADRIAKLLLELLWRCVAACEVRPGPGILFLNSARTSELIASIMLHFTQVDSILTKALQLAFSRSISTTKLQYHLAQLERLNKTFKGELYEQVASRQFFGKSTEWLSEQVEKIRSMSDAEASRLVHPESIREYGDEEDDDEDDDASSRWQGSDTDSVEPIGDLPYDGHVESDGDGNVDVKEGDDEVLSYNEQRDAIVNQMSLPSARLDRLEEQAAT
jgi:hypothetical protein